MSSQDTVEVSQDGLGAVTPLQLAKAWLAVFLVSNDSRGLKGGGSGQAGQHCSCGLQGRAGHTGRGRLRGSSIRRSAQV